MISLLEFLASCRRGELQKSSAQEIALSQTCRCNARLGALREWRKAPIPTSEGPLSGVTISAKDNIGVEGFQTYAGSAKALPSKWTRSGSFVKRLQSLGAVISSKSHCAEFALGGSGYNPNQGTPINPWSPHEEPLVPGGSSSGTAVAVASGMAMLGIGTDTGGSVRVPAALCGCVGFKASKAHWPLDGIVPLLTRSDTLGLFSRDLDDLLYAISAIDHGVPIEALPFTELTIAIWPEILMGNCDSDRLECFLEISTAIRANGCKIKVAGQAAITTADEILSSGHNTAAVELTRFLASELPQWRKNLNTQVDTLVKASESVDDRSLQARHHQFIALALHREEFFNGADVVLSPTTALSAPPLSALQSSEGYERFSNGLLDFTVIGSVYGCCGISLPAGLDSNGLPMALQLLARPGDEYRLLAAAKSLQPLLPICPEPSGL